MFMELPDDEVYCASNKVMLAFEGVGIRLTNKSLNPSHLKYSMTLSGEIQTNFKRHFDEIVKKWSDGSFVAKISRKVNETESRQDLCFSEQSIRILLKI